MRVHDHKLKLRTSPPVHIPYTVIRLDRPTQLVAGHTIFISVPLRGLSANNMTFRHAAQ